ncbi:MAG: uroporphyrinogen-III C-methyltransferase [Rhodanobacteraceae bacterium]
MDENSESPNTDPVPSAKAEGGGTPGTSSSRNAVKAVIVLIVLAALAVAAWFGWQWWQQQQSRLAAAGEQGQQQRQAVTDLRQQMTKLQQQLADENSRAAQFKDQVAKLQSRLADSDQASEAVDGRLQGLDRRTEQLEATVSGLMRKQMDGAERMRLEDVELLLTQADQRYRLLHDGVTALTALRQARRQLADVDDPAFAGVARTLDDEISALAATRPAARQEQLQQLEQLRQDWQSLPRKPSDEPLAAPVTGTWSRIWAALSTLVVVHHDSGEGSVNLADARLAQQVARIDLARAEAALLANDPARAMGAVQRVGATLAREYDADSPKVMQARQVLSQLASQLADADKVDVQLGAALTALRNQLQVRQMNATPLAPPAAEPARAQTAAGA